MLSKEQLKLEVEKLLNEGKELPLYPLSQKLHRAMKEKAKREQNKKEKHLLEVIEAKTTTAKSYDEPLEKKYQIWYSKTLPLIKQLLPDRYNEFVEQYKSENRKEVTRTTYTIYDYLNGVSFIDWDNLHPDSVFATRCNRQLAILESCLSRIDSILSNIIGTLQAEMFDDELEAADELSKKGHLRAAGALSGVTLERHLGTVAVNHGSKLSKKEPTISDFNDLFKNDGIYDVPTWRFIQRLGDIRNLSAHFKSREPTKEEIDEMIKGVQKIIKTVF